MTVKGRRVLLCVGGGIAAYKTLEVLRRLRKAGAEIRVAMTDAARHFVGPASFQALSGHPVRSSLWDESAEAAMSHIELARWADQILIAPATADLLSRLAHGFANDLVTTLCLATTAPIVVAPAMNHRMWLHPATQANIERLRHFGVTVIGPADGLLAEGESGPGRLSEPEMIVAALHDLGKTQRYGQALRGTKVVITAGPTYEDLDPVRYLGNRSSGKMGFALADSAARQGADVILIAGPVTLATPVNATRIDVRSAQQMRDAVLTSMPADIFIAAAAVADYRPAQIAPHKIKKTESGEKVIVELVRTPDILSEIAQREDIDLKLVVGFAAETENVAAYAKHKLETKRLDLIIANRVGIPGAGFESDNNSATAYWPGGERSFAEAPKTHLADQLIGLILERLHS